MALCENLRTMSNKFNAPFRDIDGTTAKYASKVFGYLADGYAAIVTGMCIVQYLMVLYLIKEN